MYAGRPPGIPVYPWKKQIHGGTARSVWTACSWHPSFQRREDSGGYKLQVWTAAEVGACIWLIFVTGALFWHHIPHGWQVHELHKKNRGSQPCSFHHPNNFWSHLSTLYMLLSCCLKRWSRLQAGFFLLGSTGWAPLQFRTSPTGYLSALFCQDAVRSCTAPRCCCTEQYLEGVNQPLVKQGIWMHTWSTGWVTELYQV